MIFKLKPYKLYRLYHKDNRILSVVKYRDLLLDESIQTGDKINKLKNLLHAESITVDRISKEWWEELCESADQGDESENLIKYTNSLDYNILSPGEWLELSSLMVGLFFYECAISFRKKAIDKAYTYKNNFILKKIYGDMLLGAAFEKWDENTIIEALEAIKYTQSRCAKSKYYNILIEYFKNNRLIDQNENEVNYRNLIEGKSLAIVGPLTNKSDNGEDIDSYDLVVRFNRIDLDAPLDVVKEGSRTDVIYNSWEVMNEFVNKYDQIRNEEVKAIICTKDKNFNKEKINNNILIRSMAHLNPYTFNGGLNHLQRVLIDLIRFEPSKMKVFGVDLFTSLNYNNNYQGPKYKIKYYADALIAHDLITQFQFTQFLHKKGVFIGDEKLEEVMSFSLKQYLDKIKGIFKDYILIKESN